MADSNKSLKDEFKSIFEREPMFLNKEPAGRTQLVQDFISRVAKKFLPFAIQENLNRVVKETYHLTDRLFAVEYDIDTATIMIKHHWCPTEETGYQLVYLEQQTESELDVLSIESFMVTMVARQYSRKYNDIIDNWLRREIQLPHGDIVTTIASPKLLIKLNPKNPEL